jgi:hypothetical protein
VDFEAMQRHLIATLSAHHALAAMSDDHGGPYDPWRALIESCRRARRGNGEGTAYLAIPF